VCFAIGDIERYSSMSIIYTFSRARHRGCARCPLFPDLLGGLGFTSGHPAFVAGLRLVGRLQKGTDVGRVLPVGEAGVGEPAVRRTSASVRSRRARGRWRLRQSESSARRSTPGGPQR
jgi:hypothetical protein